VNDFNIDPYLKTIDSKNVHEIENLIKNNNNNLINKDN